MQPIHVCNHTTPEAIYPFDARGVAKLFRHAAISARSIRCTPAKPCASAMTTTRCRCWPSCSSATGDAITIAYLQREPGAIVIDFASRVSALALTAAAVSCCAPSGRQFRFGARCGVACRFAIGILPLIFGAMLHLFLSSRAPVARTGWLPRCLSPPRRSVSSS